MPKMIPQGVMADFKKTLKQYKKDGELEKSSLVLRQQVYMRIATRFGPRFIQKNGPAVKAELDAAIEAVKNG